MNEILVLVSTDIVIEAVNVGLSIVSEAFFIPILADRARIMYQIITNYFISHLFIKTMKLLELLNDKNLTVSMQ